MQDTMEIPEIVYSALDTDRLITELQIEIDSLPCVDLNATTVQTVLSYLKSRTLMGFQLVRAMDTDENTLAHYLATVGYIFSNSMLLQIRNNYNVTVQCVLVGNTDDSLVAFA